MGAANNMQDLPYLETELRKVQQKLDDERKAGQRVNREIKAIIKELQAYAQGFQKNVEEVKRVVSDNNFDQVLPIAEKCFNPKKLNTLREKLSHRIHSITDILNKSEALQATFNQLQSNLVKYSRIIKDWIRKEKEQAREFKARMELLQSQAQMLGRTFKPQNHRKAFARLEVTNLRVFLLEDFHTSIEEMLPPVPPTPLYPSISPRSTPSGNSE